MHKVEDPQVSEAVIEEWYMRPHQAESERNRPSPCSRPGGSNSASVPAAPLRTHWQLANRTGAPLSSSEQSFKTRRLVRDMRRVVLARQEARRYSPQHNQSSACATFAHIPEIRIQGDNHGPHPPMHLQVPRKRARWRRQQSAPQRLTGDS